MMTLNHNAPLHPSEEDLIAFHLHELADEATVRAHVEHCAACAGLSESIAETLRVFSADAVPQANLDHAWQRLRINLPPLTPVPARRRRFASTRWNWAFAGGALAAMLTVGVVTLHHSKPATDMAITRPGPLSNTPADPAMANHLDSAERLLTEVNHAHGSLDTTTRTEAHDLLLKNAVYVSTAHHNGDLAQAAVLEDLGRVLTTIDHEPASNKTDDGWHIRVTMNTDGLLLDIRILRQNDQRQ